MVKFMTLIIFILMTLWPMVTDAEHSCELPCKIKTSDWSVRVKELSSSKTAVSSLWFRLENTGRPKKDVNIRASLSSPFHPFQIPLFNTVEISELPPNKEFIFQHYDEQSKSNHLELQLTWKSFGKLFTDTFYIKIDESNPL